MKTPFFVGLFLLGALSWTAQARAAAFQNSLDLAAGGGYSEEQNLSGTTGWVGHLQEIPMIALSKSDFLTVAFDGQENQRGLVRNEGNTLPAFFDQSLILTGIPEWKHLLGESGYSIALYGLATHAFLQRDSNESLGQGIYDYEMYSGGLKFEKSDPFPWMKDALLDLSFGHRDSPNYRAAGSSNAVGSNVNIDQLDVYQPEIQLTLALPMQLSFYSSITWENYTDSYQYLPDETIDATLRADQLSDIRLVWSPTLGQHFGLGVTLEDIYTNSNYDDWDSSIGVNGVEMLDYFSNNSISFAPSLNWFPSGDPNGDLISLAYVIKYTAYNHRTQINPDLSLAEGSETDAEDTIALFGRKMIFIKGLSIYTNLDLDMQQSNQFSPGVNFDYQIFDGQVGLEYKY